jgi:hypothetical protein
MALAGGQGSVRPVGGVDDAHVLRDVDGPHGRIHLRVRLAQAGPPMTAERCGGAIP